METAVFVCSHVFEKSKPILFVSREDSDWQCLCGGTHDNGELPHLVGFNHLLEMDNTLSEILDLNADWEAEREQVGGEWLRSPCYDAKM